MPCKYYLFSFLLLFYSGFSGWAEPALEDKTREWVERDLRAALQPPVDMNRVASMSFPVTTAWKRGLKRETRHILDELTAFIRNIDPAEYECGQLVDIHLTISLLLEKGRYTAALLGNRRILGLGDR